VKPKVLVSRKVFERRWSCSTSNSMSNRTSAIPYTPTQLVKKLQEIWGDLLLTDIFDERVFAQCPELKIVCNIAVGYNNIDAKAARGAAS